MIATDDGPAVSIVSLISLAAAPKRRAPRGRHEGVAVAHERLGEPLGLLSASKPKRPRSHSQPQLTASLSTPRYRTTSSRLLWTTVRQPTAHVVHVLSASSRSHGRALKRYGFAVSAPTGQICTVLPEKYELNGSSGNVITCGGVAALDEVDQRVAGHLVGEAGAAVAEDAALAVEQHELAERDRLLVVPLLLHEPARPDRG